MASVRFNLLVSGKKYVESNFVGERIGTKPSADRDFPVASVVPQHCVNLIVACGRNAVSHSVSAIPYANPAVTDVEGPVSDLEGLATSTQCSNLSSHRPKCASGLTRTRDDALIHSDSELLENGMLLLGHSLFRSLICSFTCSALLCLRAPLCLRTRLRSLVRSLTSPELAGQ